ncbi:MAG: ABC transporter permease, partial [Paracoccaceae bacterium]
MTAANAEGLANAARRERLALLGLASPALLVVMLIMVLPVGWLFYLSFIGSEGQFSLENYQRMLDSKSYARIFATTFKVSALTTGLCILIGYPLAYFLSQLPARAANICMLAVLVPFWTSLLVRTYAWLVLLQRQGLLNRWAIELGLWDEPLKLVHNMTGTLIGMVHIMLPFLVLPLYGSMKAISPDLLRASSNLGASPSRAFWTVFFPLSLPGLFAGALIVFVLSLGFFVTPAVLGGGKVI